MHAFMHCSAGQNFLLANICQSIAGARTVQNALDLLQNSKTDFATKTNGR